MLREDAVEGVGGVYGENAWSRLVFPAKFRRRDRSESCTTDVDVLTLSEIIMSSHELVLLQL